jgi:hypothetical protein
VTLFRSAAIRSVTDFRVVVVTPPPDASVAIEEGRARVDLASVGRGARY